jgi:hypothetical protein
MADYATTVRKHRRLAILRHLEQVSGYTTNASILRDVLVMRGLSHAYPFRPGAKTAVDQTAERSITTQPYLRCRAAAPF